MAQNVLIAGAGEAGRMLLREIQARASDRYHVCGFLDDNTAIHGTQIDGVDVLGACERIPELVVAMGVDEVIISVPSADRSFVRRVITLCRDAGVSFKIVPGLLEIIKGPVRLEQMRDVYPEDLLGRESVEFDDALLSQELAGARVLVTGAGGSIGGEICRQIGRFKLGCLILLGRGENQIFEIEREIRELYPSLNTMVIISDIRDEGALKRHFEESRPDFVYHAAAHKHVHYMEAFPEEAVKNNVFGTRNVIRASQDARVKRVVMLSTDKAVNPQGVMGATKRFAEYLMKRANGKTETLFMTVRFGNVLASRGSVVPLFVSQIMAGGPVTVSHEEASRFFMSLKEACMLVVHASLMGNGGEIFILQMGEPIKIVELARDLIALHGYRPDVDIDIKITGLRPGEKLHEDLVVEGEAPVPSAHPYILASTEKMIGRVDLEQAMEELDALARSADRDGIRKFFDRVIPDASCYDNQGEYSDG